MVWFIQRCGDFLATLKLLRGRDGFDLGFDDVVRITVLRDGISRTLVSKSGGNANCNE